MRSCRRAALAAALVLAAAAPVHGQQSETADSAAAGEPPGEGVPSTGDSVKRQPPYRNKLTVLPFVTYSPQTRFQLGVAGGWQFKPASSVSDSGTRPSILAGVAGVTTAGQWSVYASLLHFSLGNRWRLETGAQGAFFPLMYYGVGPRAERADSNRMDNDLLDIDFKLSRRFAPNLYAGVYSRIHAYWNISWQFPARVPAGLAGADGSRSIALGTTLLVDSRNSAFTPTRGWFLEFDALANSRALGGDVSYGTVVVDGRTYRPLNRRGDVLALNLVAQFNGRDVPIQSMSMLAGQLPSQLVMRGVYLGRFRDRHQVVGQMDYRGHLGGRWGYVVFAAAGNVFGSGTGLFDRLKGSGGAGLRFDLNPRDPLNLRVDYTLTTFGEPGVSFGATEAF
jgi:hypothetical protein